MTRDEARGNLIHAIRWNDMPKKEALEMAIKALERTEPKEVIYSGDGYADGYMVYDMAECPNCGYEYEDGDKDWGLPFCPKCGQALKWEVEHDPR